MFIENSKLSASKMDEVYIKIFNESYPDGAQVKDLLLENKLPLEFFHTLRFLYGYTAEENEIYEKNAEIIESTNVNFSDKIFNSNIVTDSREIKKSSFIKKSEDVSFSSQILFSQGVLDSKKVYNGKTIVNSQFILNSSDVTFSNYVVNSGNVSHCDRIYMSDNIENSFMINSSKRLKYCGFCSDMKDCEYCLFCYGLEGKKFHIFNKKYSKKEFFELFSEIFSLFKLEKLPEFFRDKKDSFTYIYNPFTNYFVVAPFLSNEFINFIKNIKEFDEDIFYKITLFKI